LDEAKSENKGEENAESQSANGDTFRSKTRGLEKLARQHQAAQQIALRARIVLALAEGRTNTVIAEENKVSHNTARLWRNRWVALQAIPIEELGIEERLQDVLRPGAPRQITADQRCQIETLACETPEKSGRPIMHWSAREIADEIVSRKIVKQISPRHAARLLKRCNHQAPLDSVLADERERRAF
jgi:putative transposase